MRSGCDRVPFTFIAAQLLSVCQTCEISRILWKCSLVVLHGFLSFVDVQAVEGVVLLPGASDYSQMGVKSEELHFVTAGSKGKLY